MNVSIVNLAPIKFCGSKVSYSTKPMPKDTVELPDSIDSFYEKYKDVLKKYVTDDDGNFVWGENKLNIDTDFKPFDGDMGVLEHGTSAKVYDAIKKNGFKVDKKKFAETFHGIYLTRQADGKNNYGEKQIQCRLKDGKKVAYGDANKVANCICGITEKLDGFTKYESYELAEKLLMDEFKSRGYAGLYSSKNTFFGKCKAVVIFNPDDIKL